MDQLHIRVFFLDRVLFRIYMSGNHHWFDDVTTPDINETRDDIALRAMRAALNETKGKSWGELQHLTMAHPMSQVPVISGLLGLERGPFPRAGNPGTLNATTSLPDRDGGFKALGGPSWRFLIDFADIDNVQMVIPSGQSGNPMDPHFFDFYELWATGNYWKIPFRRDAVIEAKETLLVIKSKKKLLNKLIKVVKSRHPYSVPEIVALPIISGNKDYLNWIDESCR